VRGAQVLQVARRPRQQWYEQFTARQPRRRLRQQARWWQQVVRGGAAGSGASMARGAWLYSAWRERVVAAARTAAVRRGAIREQVQCSAAAVVRARMRGVTLQNSRHARFASRTARNLRRGETFLLTHAGMRMLFVGAAVVRVHRAAHAAAAPTPYARHERFAANATVQRLSLCRCCLPRYRQPRELHAACPPSRSTLLPPQEQRCCLMRRLRALAFARPSVWERRPCPCSCSVWGSQLYCRQGWGWGGARLGGKGGGGVGVGWGCGVLAQTGLSVVRLNRTTSGTVPLL